LIDSLIRIASSRSEKEIAVDAIEYNNSFHANLMKILAERRKVIMIPLGDIEKLCGFSWGWLTKIYAGKELVNKLSTLAKILKGHQLPLQITIEPRGFKRQLDLSYNILADNGVDFVFLKNLGEALRCYRVSSNLGIEKLAELSGNLQDRAAFFALERGNLNVKLSTLHKYLQAYHTKLIINFDIER
jgi:hypothetical protein